MPDPPDRKAPPDRKGQRDPRGRQGCPATRSYLDRSST